jgi:hypothetical protein
LERKAAGWLGVDETSETTGFIFSLQSEDSLQSWPTRLQKRGEEGEEVERYR